MAAGVSLEILDLRHFAAPVLRPVLDAEGELWSKRLHWDYRSSARLLMQYLDNHLLPGYAALEAGQVTGHSAPGQKTVTTQTAQVSNIYSRFI